MAGISRVVDVAVFADPTDCALPARLQAGQQAQTRVAIIMAAKGRRVGEVSVGDCAQLLEIAAQVCERNRGG